MARKYEPLARVSRDACRQVNLRSSTDSEPAASVLACTVTGQQLNLKHTLRRRPALHWHVLIKDYSSGTAEPPCSLQRAEAAVTANLSQVAL